MHQIKNIIFLFALLLSFGCIKSYDPRIDAGASSKYVVTGRVTGTEGWQEVSVSLSSPISDPTIIPVSGCQVSILDDKGGVFPLEQASAGIYHVWMGKENLMPGTSYKVKVITPEGEELASAYDRMPNGPGLDSVYYVIKDVPTSDPAITSRIMQFYVDLNAVGDYSHFYKWEVEETWQYDAAHPIENYYDGNFNQVVPPDYSLKVCYITQPIRNVFTVSTKNLSQNIYKQYPLHFIDGHTSRLGILYSILVRQVALSEDAYNYWEKLRINSNEQGGLYEKQPFAIKGNVANVSSPDKVVLGCFYAVSEVSRRYFYKNVPGIDLDFTDFCTFDTLGNGGWKDVTPDQYPVYYLYEGFTLRILTRDCVDCRLQGGQLVKPDFWPN